MRPLAIAWRLGLLAVLVVGTAVAAQFTPVGAILQAIGRQAAGWGPWPLPLLAFFALYAVAGGLGFPGTILTFVGGTAFGLWPGALLNLAAGTAGSAISFLLARGLAHDLVQHRFAWLAARLQGLERPRTAFVTFIRLRLLPFLPHNATSFAAGLTRTPLPAFTAGTAIGILPSTLAWTYFATVVGRGDDASRDGIALRLALALGGLCVLSLLPNVVRWLRRRVSSRAWESRSSIAPAPGSRPSSSESASG